MIGIYKITSPSNKIYVGSSNNIERRFKEYKYNNGKEQVRLYNSFLKYGFINHKFEIIEECLFEDLNIRERYWQEFYDVLNKYKGLNCLYVETKEKRRILSKETKNKQKLATMGEKNPRFGVTLSEETKLKISLGNKGKIRTIEVKNKISKALLNNTYSKLNRIVINTKTGVEYRSIKKAAIDNNINYSTLVAILAGKFKNKTSLIYKI
jgi:group I intron endonuclease